MTAFIAGVSLRRTAAGVWMGSMAGFFKSGQRLIIAAAGFAAALLALAGAAQASELLDVRFGPKQGETRIVYDIMGAPQYELSGDEAGEGRLFITFSDLDGALATRGGKGHIGQISFEKTGGAAMRAVLPFKTTAKIKDVFVLEPKDGLAHHRLVVDVATADKKAFMASLPARKDDIADIIAQVSTPAPARETPVQVEPAPAAETATEVASLPTPPAPSRKDAPAAEKIVVIDPGHGGRDPGAQGQSGTVEKVVTLAAAKELASILEARGGYKVVLTRNEDETIRPDEREALARGAGADLFISLHADAIAQSAVRGGSVYTLSEEGTARSATLAKSEGNYQVYNLDLKEYDSVVGDILLDQAQKATLTNSSRFAEILIESLSGKTPLLNRSHRKGDLRVLLAADVPAVLFEMAFISNAKDEANLVSPVWRKRAMTAVADSIDAYFSGPAAQRQAQLPPAAGE